MAGNVLRRCTQPLPVLSGAAVHDLLRLGLPRMA